MRQTVTVVAVDTPPMPVPEIRVPKTHRRGRLILAVLVVASCFVGVRSWFEHRTGPVHHVFPPADLNSTDFNIVGPAAINEQFHIGYWLQRPGVEIEDVSANVGVNSAAAAIAVTVCRDTKYAFGAAPGNLQEACGSLAPARHLHLGPNDLVIVTVVPLQPGRIEIQGVHVDLSSGSRHWHENTGPSARLTAR